MVKGIKKPVPKKKPAVSDSDDEPLAVCGTALQSSWHLQITAFPRG
jgi:hypothetical protein